MCVSYCKLHKIMLYHAYVRIQSAATIITLAVAMCMTEHSHHTDSALPKSLNSQCSPLKK